MAVQKRKRAVSVEEIYNLKWFKIKNYDPFERASIPQWTRAICVRLLCASALKNDAEGKYKEIAQGWFEQLVPDPTLIRFDTDPDLQTKDPLKGYLILKPTLNLPSIFDLRIRDGFALAQVLKPLPQTRYVGFSPTEVAQREKQRLKQKRLLENKESYRSLQDELINITPGSPTNYRIVTVNLHTSDEQLKSDFSAWLEGKRRVYPPRHEIPKVPNFLNETTRCDLLDLHTHRVLAYIDLELWAKLNSRTISAKIYAKVLGKKTNTIYDTIKPKAKALLTDEAFASLLSQLPKNPIA